MDVQELIALVEKVRAAQRRRTSYETIAEMRDRVSLEKQLDAALEAWREGWVLRPGSPAWDDAWEAVAADPLNAGLPDPTLATHAESGEQWQYMGLAVGGGQCFRHRQHPRTGKREHIVVGVR